MAVIDFHKYAARAAAAPAFSEPLSPLDRRNLAAIIDAMAGNSEAWRLAVWAGLRRACDNPAPLPFAVGHIPAMAAELGRMLSAAERLRTAVADAHTLVLRRLIRGDAADPAAVLDATAESLVTAAVHERVRPHAAALMGVHDRALRMFIERRDPASVTRAERLRPSPVSRDE